jgi:hypothetical protein
MGDSVIIRQGDSVIIRQGDSVRSFPLLVFARCNAPLFTTDAVHVRPRCGGGAVLGVPARPMFVNIEHPREQQWGVARQGPPRSEVSRTGGLVSCGAGNREGQGPSVIG